MYNGNPITEDRGITPVVYVGLAAVIVIGFSGIAFTVGFGIVDTTSDKLADSGFELTNAQERKVVYTGEKTLHQENIDSLSVLAQDNDDKDEVTIYNESGSGEMNSDLKGGIEKGDVVLTEAIALEAGVNYGEEAKFIVEMNGGDTFTAGSITIPPRDFITSNGDVGFTGDVDTNVEA